MRLASTWICVFHAPLSGHWSLLTAKCDELANQGVLF